MRIFPEYLLHLIPRGLINNRFVLAGEDLVEMRDLADVLAVGEQVVHLVLIPHAGGMHLPFAGGPGLPGDSVGVKLYREIQRAAQNQKSLENMLHDLRLVGVHKQFRLHRIVPEYRTPAGVFPLLLRGGDLISDAFADDFPLELREGKKDIQGQAPHRGGRTKRLRHGGECDIVLIKEGN